MPSAYSLIQYVPDLLRNERINIGVVVLGPAEMQVHFVENWNRVRQFGGNVGALQDVAKQIEAMRPDVLRQTMESWRQSVQFTEPAASMLDADRLLIDVADRFLIDPEQQRKQYRSRQQAVAITKQHLAAALKQEINNAAAKLIRQHFATIGKLDKHECDVAIVNGRPLLAANSLSFETPEEKEIIKLVHATAWTIDDVKQRDPDFPLAVVALPPKQPLEVFDRAVSTFQALGAEVVLEPQLAQWSRSVAVRVREKLAVSGR